MCRAAPRDRSSRFDSPSLAITSVGIRSFALNRFSPRSEEKSLNFDVRCRQEDWRLYLDFSQAEIVVLLSQSLALALNRSKRLRKPMSKQFGLMGRCIQKEGHLRSLPCERLFGDDCCAFFFSSHHPTAFGCERDTLFIIIASKHACSCERTKNKSPKRY